MSSTPETESAIAALLRRAEAAHGAYETTVLGGERDAAWATWYATYLLDHGQRNLLPGDAGPVGLAATLAGLDAGFRRGQATVEWPEFYALRMVASAG